MPQYTYLVETPEEIQRFWSLVDRGDSDQCWHWQGVGLPAGYGRWKRTLSHRAAWMIANGVEALSVATVIRHQCDNPPCCNPAHLIPGTHADNVRDRESRARGNHISSVTLERIITLYFEGETYSEICLKTGCARTTIARMVKNGHLPARSRYRRSAVR